MERLIHWWYTRGETPRDRKLARRPINLHPQFLKWLLAVFSVVTMIALVAAFIGGIVWVVWVLTTGNPWLIVPTAIAGILIVGTLVWMDDKDD